MSGALQAIVFDFDGVIADSEPLHLRAFQQTLAEAQIELSGRDYYSRYLGYDDVGLLQALAADRGIPMSDREITALVARKGARLQEMMRADHVLFPGALDFIRAAAAAVPIAIASGALGVEIRRVLERERLAGCFTAIVSAEDTPVSKPAADPYRRALVQLAEAIGAPLLPAECVAIEDSPWGLLSAKAAGLRTVAVAHTYERGALDADLVIPSVGYLDMESLGQLCAT